MRYAFWSCLFLIILSGCVRYKNTDPAPVNNSAKVTIPPVDTIVVKEKHPIKYLALGDSYTYGQSVDVDKRFPEQLFDKLISEGFERDTLQLIARTGWTTGELQTAIDQAAPDSVFDIVTLLIGVNNQFRGYSLDPYKTEFASLLSQAIHFAGGDKSRVFVVSIPDYGFTPFGKSNQSNISAGIDSYNAANRAITEAQGVTYFDITPISRNGFIDPTLVADDQLHPSAKMYGAWVNLMLPEILKRLKQ